MLLEYATTDQDEDKDHQLYSIHFVQTIYSNFSDSITIYREEEVSSTNEIIYGMNKEEEDDTAVTLCEFLSYPLDETFNFYTNVTLKYTALIRLEFTTNTSQALSLLP